MSNRVTVFQFPALFLAALVWVSSVQFSPAAENAPNVAVTIRPLHSIVAAVMKGVGEPTLLLKEATSPHGSVLKPSQRQLVQNADVIVWFGQNLESGLAKVITQSGTKKRVVSALEAPGLTLFPFREAKDGHSDNHDKDHKADDHHEGHHHTGTDPHIWLMPKNAAKIAAQIAKVLGEQNPQHAKTYEQNAQSFQRDTNQLAVESEKLLAPLSAQPFLTLHDGFQYFEKRYQLNWHGSVLVDPDRPASAGHISELLEEIKKESIGCLLTEPQFPLRIAEVLQKGTGLKNVLVDPLGSALEPGPELYFELMRQMASAVKDCLAR